MFSLGLQICSPPFPFGPWGQVAQPLSPTLPSLQQPSGFCCRWCGRRRSGIFVPLASSLRAPGLVVLPGDEFSPCSLSLPLHAWVGTGHCLALSAWSSLGSSVAAQARVSRPSLPGPVLLLCLLRPVGILADTPCTEAGTVPVLPPSSLYFSFHI